MSRNTAYKFFPPGFFNTHDVRYTRVGDEIKRCEVKKAKSHVVEGKGNVLVEFEDGSTDWILGCRLYSKKEQAEKQLKYDLKHGN